jgi:hypothetical protein
MVSGSFHFNPLANADVEIAPRQQSEIIVKATKDLVAVFLSVS